MRFYIADVTYVGKKLEIGKFKGFFKKTLSVIFNLLRDS